MGSTCIVHAAVLLGVSLVAPLATRRATWLVAAGPAAVALWMGRGPAAAVLAACWPAMGAVEAVRAWASTTGRAPLQRCLAAGVPGFAAVAGVAFVASRAGWTLFGIGEPIVELTAVHFLFAGSGALALAVDARVRHPLTGMLATVLTAVAPPVVATGFVLRHPLPQVGGAVLMSAGVLLTAALQLVDGRRERGWRGALFVVSALAPWVPMVLAVAWAASLHWDVPALSVADMARTHGVLNGLFVVTGLLGRRAPAMRASRGELDRRLGRAEATELSYDHVGSTLRADHPVGRQLTRAIGEGGADFDAAVDGLRRWACHDGLGARVHPPDAAIAAGTTVLVAIPLGPLSVVVPNRVVVVVDEPDRFGFAYGTLHGHHERGEEAFVVERLADGTVRGTIRVDAVPASVAARLGRPLVAVLQRRAMQRYLDGLATAVGRVPR